MGSTTSTYALPYPITTDPADVPADVKRLADRLEIVLGQLQAATPAQPLAGDLKWVGYPVAAGSEASQCPGWLLCDGREVSRSTYAALFAKVGNAHGPGDGATTFNLPDSRGRAPMGAGTGPGLTARALGQKVGEEAHTLGPTEMPTHDHGGSTGTGKSAASNTGGGTLAAFTTQAGATGAGATGGGTSGSDSPDHAHGGSTDTHAGHSHGSPISGLPDYGGEYVMAGPSGDKTIQLWGSGTGSFVRAASGTASGGAHSHGVSVGGASVRHAHSVPSLSVPSLSIPALNVNAQPIPPLTIPQLDVPALAIAQAGGGASHNNVQPSFVGHCLIKS